MGGSYSSSYAAPTERLYKDVEEIVIKRTERLPFIIHKCSKLTKDPEGYNIWLDICNFVQAWTGKVITHKKTRDSKGNLLPYDISEKYFSLPEGDVEAAVHDMCHWLIAGKDNRKLFNCGMLDMTEPSLIKIEELAWTLETWIFSAIIGEPELVELVSPHAEIETFHYWVRVNDPVESTITALRILKSDFPKFNITLLRRILASWLIWKRNNPSKDAMPRGCLGWNSIGLENTITKGLIVQPIGFVSSIKNLNEYSEALDKSKENAKEEAFSRHLDFDSEIVISDTLKEVEK